MANTISPFGARDFVHQGGSQRTEELATAWIMSSDAVPIFNGDLVQNINPVSTATGSSAYGMYIAQGCSVTSGWCGVFRGCEYYNATINRMVYSPYWPGSGATGDVRAFYVSDPSQRFVIQASSQAVIGSSQVNTLFNVAIGGTISAVASAGGNTTTGVSGMQLGSSISYAIAKSTAATATDLAYYPFRLVDFYSNHAPNSVANQPSAGSSLSFVNGVDNTSVGQWVIVEPWSWMSKGF